MILGHRCLLWIRHGELVFRTQVSWGTNKYLERPPSQYLESSRTKILEGLKQICSHIGKLFKFSKLLLLALFLGTGSKIVVFDNSNWITFLSQNGATPIVSSGQTMVAPWSRTQREGKVSSWLEAPEIRWRRTFGQIFRSNFQSCVGASVEFLDLDSADAEWEKMPKLRESRCCSPMVGRVFFLVLAESCGNLTRGQIPRRQ